MYESVANDYEAALKLGRKCQKENSAKGSYPYLPSLESILDEKTIPRKIDCGIIDIPIDKIVGTRTEGRQNAFAANFMPLLDTYSEFGIKWKNLATAHLGDTGITDPILCVEYMGKFYVQEGNKRVSVLRYYGARSISAHVTRFVPPESDDESVKLYYEFLDFYALSRLYTISFTRLGQYKKLQKLLGFAPDYVWSEADRRSVNSAYSRLVPIFNKLDIKSENVNPGDVLLLWLELYPLDDLRLGAESRIEDVISNLVPDILALSHKDPVALSTEEDTREPGTVARLTKVLFSRNHINVAFIYGCPPDDNFWVEAHEYGRHEMEEILGDRVTTSAYTLTPGVSPDELMEQAAADGAEVIIGTTTDLIFACHRMAVKHPRLYVLNCSVYYPYASVRSYNMRDYEGKFIAGAIAGAMAGGSPVGYVASYPAFGVMAGINAFALGCAMTNPTAKVILKWHCLPGDPVSELFGQGARIISNHSIPLADVQSADFGTWRAEPDGSPTILASPVRKWGEFYAKLIDEIIETGWLSSNEKAGDRAVNYWWGIKSGVVDINIYDSVPAGVKWLAMHLRDDIKEGWISPFNRVIVNQNGETVNDGSRNLTNDEILKIDWLCENIIGTVPSLEEVFPRARDYLELQGLGSIDVTPN